MESIPAFEAILRRQSARNFSQKPISDQLLFELLELANRAPSGFNLQPWYFVVVRDEELKRLLHRVALEQSQVVDAPLTVVFVADPHAWKTTYPQILAQSVATGAITKEYAKLCRRNVAKMFSLGPLGLWGLTKRLLHSLERVTRVAGPVITTGQECEHYVRAHTMLAAGTFILSASSAGLATCAMEGFDEPRLKKLLAIPSHMSVPVIVALGYPLEGDAPEQSYRVPVIEKISLDLFPNRLSKLKKKSDTGAEG